MNSAGPCIRDSITSCKGSGYMKHIERPSRTMESTESSPISRVCERGLGASQPVTHAQLGSQSHVNEGKHQTHNSACHPIHARIPIRVNTRYDSLRNHALLEGILILPTSRTPNDPHEPSILLHDHLLSTNSRPDPPGLLPWH